MKEQIDKSNDKDRVRWGVWVKPETIHRAKSLAVARRVNIGQLIEDLIEENITKMKR